MVIPLLILAAFPCIAVGVEEDTARYQIQWNPLDFPRAHITAEFHCSDDRIRTTDLWMTFFDDPNGWSRFIENLVVADADGHKIACEKLPGPTWRLDHFDGGSIRVSYEVNFDFARRRWDMGNEQIALLKDGVLYTTCLPLFIFSPDVQRAEINFKVPDGWNVSAPWPMDRRGVHLVKDMTSLIRNCLMVGPHTEIRLKERNFNLIFAAMDPLGQSKDLLLRAFLRILRYYVDLFGYDLESTYLMALIPGPEDGEAFSSSFASATEIVPNRDNVMLWGNNLAHEFFHYWNGRLITTDRDHYAERQWFSEGATEYSANLALLRLGLISREAYMRKFERHLSMYLLSRSNPFLKSVSLREAGSRKWHNRPTVYSGGVAAAFCLDVAIRGVTGNERSIEDLFRKLFDDFGRTGRRYIFADLIEDVSSVAGRDFSGFFAKYIEGKETLPLPEYLSRAGLKGLIDGYDVYVLIDEKADPEASALRESLFAAYRKESSAKDKLDDTIRP